MVHMYDVRKNVPVGALIASRGSDSLQGITLSASCRVRVATLALALTVTLTTRSCRCWDVPAGRALPETGFIIPLVTIVFYMCIARAVSSPRPAHHEGGAVGDLGGDGPLQRHADLAAGLLVAVGRLHLLLVRQVQVQVRPAQGLESGLALGFKFARQSDTAEPDMV